MENRLSRTEFVALTAMLMATVALSIDAMLPALPEIAQDLTAQAPNRAQLVITGFVFGIGCGTFLAGPLSDSFGRKTVIVGGAGLYVLATLAAFFAQSLETMLAARTVMGFGAAAPRIVALAMVRDLYAGRYMARIVSFAMMVFTLVPAIAPLLGSVIIATAGWRAIFLVFVVFSALSVGWLALRQPETLPPERRRPLSFAPIWAATREILRNRMVTMTIAVQALAYATLFGTLSSTQQVFDVTFGRGESFPLWFALIALLAGTASVLNAVLVVRLGMRYLVTVTLAAQILLSGGMAGATMLGLIPETLTFPAYLLWTAGVFFMAGLVLGNLNALALEPMGHIAGTAASVVGALSTVGSVLVAIPIGLAFDGTPLPLMTGVLACTTTGFILMRALPGR
ncbi:DHA1 family bicyclomycin/chloramphenicol resistance-like MFS transporter [Rhodovulum imhoffii]|uniref:DHA1 family bicyclomycin/chloramphenicol resistance-like MFS transporter n=1 Tax=Rhodovulum imhoffii TaxID=365340 RepID=A0A2T5BTR6_9RHOB|nr:multidrug effflux MFS transporter [Rhodovulum imhoffii]MBK5934105.1 multidrug MFS transporter [Rhodovulum imhoffii]PTN02822.1 DHA1 family bicyclomycin/chloramphenicol resistance-like MFS transporter [Rhodovulum imhoffii]